MKLTDKELGMDRSISRRDFLNGAASAAAVTAIPGDAFADSQHQATGSGAGASISVAIDQAYRAVAEVI